MNHNRQRKLTSASSFPKVALKANYSIAFTCLSLTFLSIHVLADMASHWYPISQSLGFRVGTLFAILLIFHTTNFISMFPRKLMLSEYDQSYCKFLFPMLITLFPVQKTSTKSLPDYLARSTTYFWLSPMYSAPSSKENPLILTVFVRPPTLSMASRTVRSILGHFTSSQRAAERPESPAPTTITFFGPFFSAIQATVCNQYQ